MESTYKKNKWVFLEDLGLIDYKDSWDYQESLLKKIVDKKLANRKNLEAALTPNYLLFAEHPHVYTLGKSGEENHLLVSQDQLRLEKISYYKINRGGDITYHGPGQIVGYPIFDLENFFTDINKYLRNLEEVIIRTLSDYEIEGCRSQGETGVWLGIGTPFARKICAMGIRASRWVTMHGFAFNINTELNYFEKIIPCGIRNKTVTSLARELNREIPIKEVKRKLLKHFREIFELEFIIDP